MRAIRFASVLPFVAVFGLATACGDDDRPGGPGPMVGGDAAVDSTVPPGEVPGHCADGRKSGDESAIDCGGSCAKCKDGDLCRMPADCLSNSCRGGRCLQPTCEDMVQNNDESDVDCGGSCQGCDADMTCVHGGDCASQLCQDGVCAGTSCGDALLNAGETDVDCGGMLCDPCGATKICVDDTDCASNRCEAAVCAESSCDDGVFNGTESDVDCGGTCEKCRDGLMCNSAEDCTNGNCVDAHCISCMDNVQNGDETDVDCGGSCGPCNDRLQCDVNEDCMSTLCIGNLCVSCSDFEKNGNETDVDCGGDLCDPCEAGQMCVEMADCNRGLCVDSLCITCDDGVMNGNETDVDCGGDLCDPCPPGDMCVENADCHDLKCVESVCEAPNCEDMLLNGTESSVDCGGTMCDGCPIGIACNSGADCETGVCDTDAMTPVCLAPTCTDGVRNGGETDIDCGGATMCDRCADFKFCTAPTDCATNQCTMGVCGDVGCVPFPNGPTDDFGYFGCSLVVDPASLPCPDISATGTELSMLSDDGNELRDIGFTFNYYGMDYTEVYVSSNGGLGFGSDETLGTHGDPIPHTNSFDPDQMVAVWWDDLNPESTDSFLYVETRGSAPDREFVVQWSTRHFSGPTDPIRVTAVLEETTNNIRVCYHDTVFTPDMGVMTPDLEDNGADAFAGIQGGMPVSGLQFSDDDTANLTAGTLLRYFPPSD